MAVPDLNLRYIPSEKELLAFSCFVENNLYANLPHLTDSVNTIDKADKAAMLYTSVKTPTFLITLDEHSHQELCDSEEASVCTEDEMVAIEQLTRLKRRRMEEEEEEELSFSNSEYLATTPSPLTAPSNPSSDLNLASTSTISEFSGEVVSAEYSSSTSGHNDNINIFVNIEVDEPEDQDLISLSSDFDERPKPKIRMLSDIYSTYKPKPPARINGTSSPAGPSDTIHHDLSNINNLVMNSKRRRKSVNMLIMKKATVFHQ